MSELAASDSVQLGEGVGARHIRVYELTPAQMRQMLIGNRPPGDGASEDEIARYQIGATLFDDITLADLALFTRTDQAELEEIPPSHLKRLVAKCKELNPDFFAALGRMAFPQSTH